MRSAFALLAIGSLLTSPSLGAQGLQFELNGKKHTMLPLGYSSRTVFGLQRNGYTVELDPDEIKNPQIVSRFRPYSQSEMRGDLLREFGNSFEVTGTGNYLIVHPKGARDLWADRFERLYRSMAHFFRSRGFPMAKPEFPLVGVVFYSQSQYTAYCRRVLKSSAAGTLGVYRPDTNRIYLFDATQGNGTKSAMWEDNLATIMHEVAHQTGFNTGIHVRGANTPHWLVEGLGCLFEARGIYDAHHYRNQADRINVGRLIDFKKHVAGLKDSHHFVAKLVSSDRWFRSDSARAYAAAWALTFYLSERQPRDYVGYIQAVAKRESLQEYSNADRAREFARFFGKDDKMLATRVKRFIDGIPVPASPN